MPLRHRPSSKRPPVLSFFSSVSASAQSASKEAQRILHSLSTITCPSALHCLLSDILLHGLHLNSAVSAAFISSSLSLRRPRPALLLFSLIRRPSPFVCNTLMGSLLPFRPSAPLFLFHQIHLSSLPTNHHTFSLILKSLSLLRFLRSGRSLHSHVLKLGFFADSYISSSLLHLYAICSDCSSAIHLFDELPQRGVVAWSTLIAGLVRDGRPGDALLAFERMHFAGVTPNRVTLVSALSACSAYGAALEIGKWVHHRAILAGWELDIFLGTALIDMYGKHGRINSAIQVFVKMSERNVFTWNSLIQGFAFANNGKVALKWFSRMEEERVKPDSVTIIGVLTACSHSGLVDSGKRIFDMLVQGNYGFKAGIKHYGCMVDLYGRAGLLDAAIECIKTMPFEPNVVIYGSLLAACRLKKDMSWGEFAAWKMVELQPENAAYYVLLSNLYAKMGRWREAEEVWKMMRERGLRKDCGWTLTELDDIEEYVEKVV
ncbi:Pentatricopeptide repeat-containing protein [Apostasia shenzhenica]|uniref:Pentatricopeptide repeat-containing protein n=1 Tax=Apostasia shenzhenica TaxID=1088818 RepID=A0A2I0AUX4_9ASPA|nr:Pentatricopeptide repeat-containing protein [Apostasia shenzhenica]